MCITVFVFSSIFFSSLSIAFIRPWNGKYFFYPYIILFAWIKTTFLKTDTFFKYSQVKMYPSTQMLARLQWINILTFICVIILLDNDSDFLLNVVATDMINHNGPRNEPLPRASKNGDSAPTTRCVADCGIPVFIEETVPEKPKIPKATTGEDFPWDDIRSW